MSTFHECLPCMVATQHKRRKASADGTHKTWTQRPLAVSRVMQCFRDAAVRQRLLHEADSLPYLQRKHFKLTSTGFATVGEAAAAGGSEDPPPSIYTKLAEAREMA